MNDQFLGFLELNPNKGAYQVSTVAWNKGKPLDTTLSIKLVDLYLQTNFFLLAHYKIDFPDNFPLWLTALDDIDLEGTGHLLDVHGFLESHEDSTDEQGEFEGLPAVNIEGGNVRYNKIKIVKDLKKAHTWLRSLCEDTEANIWYRNQWIAHLSRWYGKCCLARHFRHDPPNVMTEEILTKYETKPWYEAFQELPFTVSQGWQILNINNNRLEDCMQQLMNFTWGDNAYLGNIPHLFTAWEFWFESFGTPAYNINYQSLRECEMRLQDYQQFWTRRKLETHINNTHERFSLETLRWRNIPGMPYCPMTNFGLKSLTQAVKRVRDFFLLPNIPYNEYIEHIESNVDTFLRDKFDEDYLQLVGTANQEILLARQPVAAPVQNIPPNLRPAEQIIQERRRMILHDDNNDTPPPSQNNRVNEDIHEINQVLHKMQPYRNNRRQNRDCRAQRPEDRAHHLEFLRRVQEELALDRAMEDDDWQNAWGNWASRNDLQAEAERRVNQWREQTRLRRETLLRNNGRWMDSDFDIPPWLTDDEIYEGENIVERNRQIPNETHT